MRFNCKIIFFIVCIFGNSLNSVSQEESLIGFYKPKFKKVQKKHKGSMLSSYCLEIKKDSSYTIAFKSDLYEMCSFGKIELKKDSLKFYSAYQRDCANTLYVEEFIADSEDKKMKIVFRSESQFYNNDIVPLTIKIDTLTKYVASIHDTILVDEEIIQKHPIFVKEYLITPYSVICFNGIVIKDKNAEILCINLPRTCNCGKYDFSDNGLFIVRKKFLIHNGIKYKHY